MLRYQQQFTFFDMARVNKSVRYVNLSEDVIGSGLKTLLGRIVQEVEATSPRVVIVDSFRTVAQAAGRRGRVVARRGRVTAQRAPEAMVRCKASPSLPRMRR